MAVTCSTTTNKFLLLCMVLLLCTLDAFTLIATEEEFKDGTIQCPQNEDCTIYCNEEEACEKTKIFCPVHNECTVWCGYGINACKGAIIDARYSSYFSLNDCETGDDSTCAEMTVYFPPNQSGEKIGALNTGNNFKRALKLYAVYGWLDVDTSGVTGDASSNIDAVMHCSWWYETHCVVAVDEWRCNEEQHTCNDPPYYTEQTPSVSTTAMATTPTQTASAPPNANDDDGDVDVVHVDGYVDTEPTDVDDTNDDDDADEQPSQSQAPVTSQASAEVTEAAEDDDDGDNTEDDETDGDGDDVGDGDDTDQTSQTISIDADDNTLTSTSTSTSTTIVDPDLETDSDVDNESVDTNDMQNDANLMEQQTLPSGSHQKGAANLEYIIAVLVGCLCVCVVLFTYYVTRHTKFYRRAMDIDKTIEHQRQKSAGRATTSNATAGAEPDSGVAVGVTPQGPPPPHKRSKSNHHNVTHPELEIIVDELQKIAEQNPLRNMLSPRAKREKKKSNKSLSGLKAFFTHKLHQASGSLPSMGGEAPMPCHSAQRTNELAQEHEEDEEEDEEAGQSDSDDHEGDRFVRQQHQHGHGKLPDMEIMRNNHNCNKYAHIPTIPDHHEQQHDDADSVGLTPNPPHIPEIADQDSAESNPSMVGTHLSYCEYLKHKKPSLPFNIMPPTGSVTNHNQRSNALQPPPALQGDHEPAISRMSSLSELTAANGQIKQLSPSQPPLQQQPQKSKANGKHKQTPKQQHHRFDTHTLIAPRSYTPQRPSMHCSKAKTNGAMILRLNSNSSSAADFKQYKSKPKARKSGGGKDNAAAVYRLNVNGNCGDSDSVDTLTPRTHQSSMYQSRSNSKQTVFAGGNAEETDSAPSDDEAAIAMALHARNLTAQNRNTKQQQQQQQRQQEMLFGRHVIDDATSMTSRSPRNDDNNMSRGTSTNTKEHSAMNASRRSSSAATMDTFQVRKSMDSSAMSADTWLTTYRGGSNT